jgi:hypothetical protein
MTQDSIVAVQGVRAPVQDELTEVAGDGQTMIDKGRVENGRWGYGAQKTIGTHVMGADEENNPGMVQADESKKGEGGMNVKFGAKQAVRAFHHFLHTFTDDKSK